MSAPARAHPVARVLMVAIVAGVAIYFLGAIKFVVLSFLAAACVAAALAPLGRRVAGRHRRVGGTIVGIGFVLAVLAGLGALGRVLGERIQELLKEWPELQSQLTAQVRALERALGFSTGVSVEELGRQVLSGLTGGQGDLLSGVASMAGSILVGLALVAFGLIYLLGGEPGRLRSALQQLWPRHADRIERSIGDLEYRLRWWALGMVVSMTIVGTLSGLGFWAIGLRLALPLAVLAGIAEIVPTFGPAVVFAFTLLVAATEGTGAVMWVAIIYLGVQLIESYVLLPLVMRGAVALPPIVTLFTVILWGRIFGFLGLLLAVPLNLTLWTLADHFWTRRRDP